MTRSGIIIDIGSHYDNEAMRHVLAAAIQSPCCTSFLLAPKGFTTLTRSQRVYITYSLPKGLQPNRASRDAIRKGHHQSARVHGTIREQVLPSMDFIRFFRLNHTCHRFSPLVSHSLIRMMNEVLLFFSPINAVQIREIFSIRRRVISCREIPLREWSNAGGEMDKGEGEVWNKAN